MENNGCKPTGSEGKTPPQGAPLAEEPQGADRKTAFPNWGDLLSILGMFFFSSVVAALVVGLFFPNFSLGGPGLAAAYSVQFLITISFALFLKKYRTGTFRHVVRISWKGFDPKVILWGLILMLAVSVVIEPVTALFPDEWINRLNDRIASGGWGLATTILIAPVCEEILFRGILQDSTVRKYGAWKGILLASFLFGVVHLIPQQIVAATCVGCVIGYIYYRTGSLFAAVVLHAINNTLAVFTILLVDEENRNQTLREFLGSDTLYFLAYAGCAVLVVLSVASVVRLVAGGRLTREGVAEKKPQSDTI